MMSHGTPLSFLEKLATWGSLALAGAVFLTVGWLAVEPDDPLGAVSLLARRGAWMMLLQSAGLAGVTATLATVLAGRRVTDVGTFAAAIGLAIVSLRGKTAEYLLVQGADRSATFTYGLGRELAVEALAWAVVVLVSACVSAWVMRWCYAGIADAEVMAAAERSDPSAPGGWMMAGWDLPLLRAVCGRGGCAPTPLVDGLKHALIVTGACVLAFNGLSAGMAPRAIQHGQVCFVVAAVVYTACYLAHRMVPVRSAAWSILAVMVFSVLGYLWASTRPAALGRPLIVPTSPYLSVLPIQFICVGTAAALATFWSAQRTTPRRASRTQPAADDARGA